MFNTKEQAIISQAIAIIESKALTSDLFTSPAATKQFCQLQLAGSQIEQFAALFLTSQHQLIRFDVLATGTIDGASVYPREVAKSALDHNAAAVIFTHNHPSGVANPSSADKAITKRLVDALNLFDIRVLDHIITGDKETFSFAENGLI
jgi:DNA repair protein RadC